MVNDKQSAVSRRPSAVYVYMVECADQTLYTGWTTDITRRLKAHNTGRGARYTQQRGPVRLVYLEELPDRRTALKRELQIKRMPRADKLKLIKEGQIADSG
ncbi:MAG: GIY-YIG nuclease family protein [Anaerolineae bacterium]|nr:GIY-YIG nuclease family protein [Anaerolineae bacterium]